ncbi:ricin-type beta-trefoil lectin domain protein [Streptomyces sp. NPDC051286]|uniref:ricin-type beta-trefoil lectin domain protein n=1 Tax=Streptomyces sp. NPDC051286 TaxID=3365647 RepID=UPI0037BA48F4
MNRVPPPCRSCPVATGRSVDQRDRRRSERPGSSHCVLADIVRTALPAPVEPGPITGIDGRCAAPEGGSSADGTALRLSACDGTPAQTWTVPGDGTLVAFGTCMDVRNGATADGTAVQLYRCNGTLAQSWTPLPDGTLCNVKSALCLHAEGGATDGARLLIRTCGTAAEQQWELPG